MKKDISNVHIALNEKKFKRNIGELRKYAVLHWPEEIIMAASKKSSLPLLLKTQKSFISILTAANASPNSWKFVLNENINLTPKLFLKHLMVISDLGGEALNKIAPLSKYFSNNELKFLWGECEYVYKFQVIHGECSLANSSLGVDAKSLLAGSKVMSPKTEDVCMLLLFGNASINSSLPSEVSEKCMLGDFLGNADDLTGFIEQRYIYVSRQVAGANSNALGHVSQEFVKDRLDALLPNDWVVALDGKLPNVSHSSDGETTFDVVVRSPSGNYFGVEVSFQVTTNSVIERKSREAASVQSACHEHGHRVCYVIDGAGNINVRTKAVGNICEHSDCTVAMSESEIGKLAAYMREVG